MVSDNNIRQQLFTGWRTNCEYLRMQSYLGYKGELDIQ